MPIIVDSITLSKDLKRSRQAPAYAASLTIDATAGEIVDVGALTGAITINAPTNPVAGQELIFLLLQDGTGGRAVTWNAAFTHSWSDTGNTANKRASILFVYSGGGWLQVGAQRVWA
jgi:hypothetical protein